MADTPDPESVEPDEAFEKLIWGSGEICNNCYSQVRAIGEEMTIEGSLHTHAINRYYERTEHGTQEHTPFELPSNRFGTTFCTECGSDTRNLGHDKDIGRLAQDAKRIIEYVNSGDEPPYTIDGRIMGKTIKDIKQVPANQGYDPQILAYGAIRGMFND